MKAQRLSVILLIFFPCIFAPIYLNAQTAIIAGTIRDATTNELLPLTNISVKGTTTGTTTDTDGKFSLSLAGGDYELLVNLTGYKTETIRVSIQEKNIALDIRLFPTDILLQEVTVYSTTAADKAEQNQTSSLSLQSRTISEISSVLPDVFRSLQSLPGISANNEFSARFNVRGGNADENLVLVNGAQVYEPFHVKEADNASIGIFNVDLMRKVDIITGGFSARYGDRMSSVLNIEYREGNRERLAGSSTLSLTNLDGYLEGPLGSKGSFLIGGRKSYLEYVLSLLDIEEGVKPSFYDVQGVLTYSLSKRHKLLGEFIHAGDHFRQEPLLEQFGPFVNTVNFAANRRASTSTRFNRKTRKIAISAIFLICKARAFYPAPLF